MILQARLLVKGPDGALFIGEAILSARRPRTLAPTTWDSEAACIGWPSPDDFFPDRGEENPAVLLVCHGCPVARPCADRALRERQRYGIWGGLTERDRERIWEQRAARRRAAVSTERLGA